MVVRTLVSVLQRVATAGPIGLATMSLLDFAVKKFAWLAPRDMLEGIDSFFFRDMIGNIDLDGDGVLDSFRFAVTNAWFDQRITGIELYLDGRRVPGDRVIFRSPAGEERSSDVTVLDFPPGDAMEIIAEGFALADGFHIIDMTLGMELVSQLVPLLPIVVKDGVGDVSILPDRMHPFPAFPPPGVTPGRAHVVPHVHYDVEWLHTRRVFEKVGEANLREMLRLMEADPEMTFVLDQVPQLEPFRRRNPGEFDRIVALITSGRIEPVNGMYSEPDVNIIGGESLVRQTVAWQRYALEHLGALSRCGWLIDSFGMSAQLPQILAKSGVEFFAYSRATVPEGEPSEFIWEGLDGTRILAHNMPRKYNIGYPMPTDRGRAMRKMLRDYEFLRGRSASAEVFYPGGVDHGRPQGAHGEMVREWNREVKGAAFEFSLPSRFFASLSRDDLPVMRGEFQRELWGTYSARTRIKRLNRECEFALAAAEKLSTVASLHGADYPAAEIDGAWRTLMDNHFHDQICGCCTDEVALGMMERFGEVLGACEGLMGRAAGALVCPRGPSETGAGPALSLFAFNPLAQPVTSWTEFEAVLPPGWRSLSVRGGEEEQPFQLIDATRYGDGSLKRVRVGFVPELPALGYRVFELLPAEGEAPRPGDAVEVRGTALSNGILTVEVDGSSGLLGEVVLADGTRFDLRGAGRLTLERDFGSLYDARALGTTYMHRRVATSVRAVESGPLRGTIEVRGRVGRSPFTQRVSLVSGSPRIDIETDIDFKSRGCRLRCRFPTGILGGTWTHEIPYGAIERPGHELPAQNWVDLSAGDRGVTLINFGTPGNKLAGGTIYLTLLRSSDKLYLWDAGPLGFEVGKHEFRSSLYPHRDSWRTAGSNFEAYRRNDPPRAFVFPGAQDANRPRSFSYVSCSSRDALVSVLGRAEDGTVVLRLWETAGRAQEVELVFGWEPARAFRADLLERRGEPVAVEDGRLALKLGPFEISTLMIDGVTS